MVDQQDSTNHYVLLSGAEDSHAPFMGYLVRALKEVQYRTILDLESDELELNAIEAASVSVVILSDQYLSFPSCLDKLADISEVAGQLFLPVLYDVKPPGVKHRIHAYSNTVHPQRFQRWAQAITKALTALPHFTHCHFQRDGDTFAYKCIEKIVQVISRHVASATVQNPKERLILQLLELRSEDGVCVVGIGGDHVIGKIIARRVYNTIGGEGFDAYCFLDLEENLIGPLSGHFKSMFLSGMVANNPGISSITNNTLNLMKVFVVFQGINDLNRWKYAVELINEFGSGSRVILTSQDIALLQRVYEVERPDRITPRFVRVGDSTEIHASGHPLEQKHGTPDDRNSNWDPMELESQLSSSSSFSSSSASSSSSSLDALCCVSSTPQGT